MFFDIAESRKIPINNSQDVIIFLKSDKPLRDLLPKLNKLVRIILIILASLLVQLKSLFLHFKDLKYF